MTREELALYPAMNVESVNSLIILINRYVPLKAQNDLYEAIEADTSEGYSLLKAILEEVVEVSLKTPPRTEIN